MISSFSVKTHCGQSRIFHEKFLLPISLYLKKIEHFGFFLKIF